MKRLESIVSFLIFSLVGSLFAATKLPPNTENLTAKCGSEIQWRPTWEQACTEAKKTNRLLFVVPSERPDFPPFVQEIISRRLNGGILMDLKSVDLLNRKFIPVQVKMDNKLVEQLELKKSKNQSFLFLSPDLKPVDAPLVDLAYAELFYTVLRSTLKSNPQFDSPSDETAGIAAQSKEDAATRILLGTSLIKDGKLEEALDVLKAVLEANPSMDEKAQCHYQRSIAYTRLRQGKEGEEEIATARSLDPEDHLKLHDDFAMQEALLQLGQKKNKQALQTLISASEKYAGADRINEILYTLGVVYVMQRDEPKGTALWSKLIEEHPENRWAWQSARTYWAMVGMDAGTGGSSPCMPVYEWLEGALQQNPRATERPTPVQDLATAVQEGCQYLITHSLEKGGWGARPGEGTNFVMWDQPITALGIMALYEWREILPTENQSTREKALAQLDSWNLKSEAKMGRTCSLLYYLCLHNRLIRDASAENKPAHLQKMNTLILALKQEQAKDGNWMKYPFITAAALIALHDAKAEGAEIPAEMVEKALKGMMSSKTKDDMYGYHAGVPAAFEKKQALPEGGAGRLPVCYLAEFLWGKCDETKLTWALDLFMKYRSEIVGIRKSIFSHQGEFANAPYFLYFDYYYASEVAKRLPPEKRKAYLTEMKAEILQIGEKDGSWIDCYHNGYNYGTAMALMILHNCDSN